MRGRPRPFVSRANRRLLWHARGGLARGGGLSRLWAAGRVAQARMERAGGERADWAVLGNYFPPPNALANLI